MQRMRPDDRAGFSTSDIGIVGERRHHLVYLVYEQEGVGQRLGRLDQLVDVLLERSVQRGAGEQFGYAHLEYPGALEPVRYRARLDAHREALDQCGLADAALADDERVRLPELDQDRRQRVEFRLAAVDGEVSVRGRQFVAEAQQGGDRLARPRAGTDIREVYLLLGYRKRRSGLQPEEMAPAPS